MGMVLPAGGTIVPLTSRNKRRTVGSRSANARAGGRPATHARTDP
jgi:hypothetical protein